MNIAVETIIAFAASTITYIISRYKCICETEASFDESDEENH